LPDPGLYLTQHMFAFMSIFRTLASWFVHQTLTCLKKRHILKQIPWYLICVSISYSITFNHTTDTMPIQIEFEKAKCKKVGKLFKFVKGEV